MQAKIKRNKLTSSDKAMPVLCFEISKEAAAQFENKDLTGYTLTVKKSKSKSMNSYMWHLCDEISKVINATKEEVYRQAVRDVGKWIDTKCKAEDTASMQKVWSKNGIGWFSQVLHKSNYSQLRLYIGSSVYEDDELWRLTSYVVDEAKNLGIETLTPDELTALYGGDK